MSELFTEVSIPLVEGLPFVTNLTLDLGYRYSNYSTFGSEPTYKTELEWSVIEELKLRASYNRAVRTPVGGALYASQISGSSESADPCEGDTPSMSSAGCANTGVSDAQYGNIAASPSGTYNTLYGGNPDLTPEIADTITLGLVAQPFENLNFTLDYWNIELEDAISALDEQQLIGLCGNYGVSKYCDRINRSDSGTLWSEGGYVDATNLNLGELYWRGVDLSVNYSQDLLGGTINANLIGSYMDKKETTPVAESPESAYDCSGLISSVCAPQPDWRHTASLSYTQDTFWRLSANWRYIGGVDYDGDVDQIVQDGIGSYNYIDLKATFEVNDYTSVLFGANNIFDKEPPLVGTTLRTNANTIAGFYDTLGRFLHASVTFKI